MQIGEIYSFPLDLHVQQKKLVTKSQKRHRIIDQLFIKINKQGLTLFVSHF